MPVVFLAFLIELLPERPNSTPIYCSKRSSGLSSPLLSGTSLWPSTVIVIVPVNSGSAAASPALLEYSSVVPSATATSVVPSAASAAASASSSFSSAASAASSVTFSVSSVAFAVSSVISSVSPVTSVVSTGSVWLPEDASITASSAPLTFCSSGAVSSAGTAFSSETSSGSLSVTSSDSTAVFSAASAGQTEVKDTVNASISAITDLFFMFISPLYVKNK